MKNHEVPLRSRLEMAKDVAELIKCLHSGQRSAGDLLIEDLKTRSIYLEESVQQAVLMFAEQIQFQYDYDPWHQVTPEVQKAADHLLKAIGIDPPK